MLMRYHKVKCMVKDLNLLALNLGSTHVILFPTVIFHITFLPFQQKHVNRVCCLPRFPVPNTPLAPIQKPYLFQTDLIRPVRFPNLILHRLFLQEYFHLRKFLLVTRVPQQTLISTPCKSCKPSLPTVQPFLCKPNGEFSYEP